MPGDEHISCAHELSLWALHTVTIASHSIGSKYISNERQDALQKRIQGACKMATPHPSIPVGLTYSSLAIDDDRCVSNEIECLAHEYYNGSRFPARFFSLAISRPLTPVSPIWIMRALEAARTTRGDAFAVITI